MKQSKQLYLMAFIAVFGFSCQNQAVNESMAANNENNVQIVRNEALFAAVPLSSNKVCNQEVSQNCNHEMHQLQLQLMKLDPIPMPRAGEPLKLSVSQATDLYKSFVTAHANEPIVWVFRQLYARAMLHQYGVLASSNYELIGYYTAELTDANSMDFATLAKAATVLQGKIKADEFARLVNTTTERAQHYEKMREKLANKLALTLNGKAAQSTSTDDPRAAKFLLDNIKKSTIGADVIQLSRLRATLN